jgi:hypothetical protein
LADGTLAAVPPAEATTHQALLTESLREHSELPFIVKRGGKHPTAFLSRDALRTDSTPAPRLTDPAFEERMNAYLRSLEQEESPDSEAFFRKKPTKRRLV